MKRNREIRVKYSKEELDKVKKMAEQLGIQTSTMVRMLSLKATIHPTDSL